MIEQERFIFPSSKFYLYGRIKFFDCIEKIQMARNNMYESALTLKVIIWNGKASGNSTNKNATFPVDQMLEFSTHSSGIPNFRYCGIAQID